MYITSATHPTIIMTIPSQGISTNAATLIPTTVKTNISMIILTVLLVNLAASKVPAFNQILMLYIQS